MVINDDDNLGFVLDENGDVVLQRQWPHSSGCAHEHEYEWNSSIRKPSIHLTNRPIQNMIHSWIIAGNANIVSDLIQAFISPIPCFIRPPDLFKLNNCWLLNMVSVRVDKLATHSSCLLTQQCEIRVNWPRFWDQWVTQHSFFIIFYLTLAQEKLVKPGHVIRSVCPPFNVVCIGQGDRMTIHITSPS